MEQILHRFDPREWVIRPHIELCLSKTPDFRSAVKIVVQTTFVQAIEITAQISYWST